MQLKKPITIGVIMRKAILILTLIFIVACAACLLFACNSVAYADESSNYEIVLPDKNYAQFKEPSAYLFANGSHFVADSGKIVRFDANAKNDGYTAAKFYNVDFTIKSMTYFENSILINSGSEFKKLNLTDGTIDTLTLDGVTADYDLFASGGLLIAVCRSNGQTKTFDGSFSKIADQTVEAFTYSRIYALSDFVYSLWFKFDLESGAHYFVSKVNPQTFETSTLFETSALNKLCVGSSFVYVLSEGKIDAYDFEGNSIFSQNVAFDDSNVYANGNFVYVLNKQDKSIDTFTADINGLTHSYSIRQNGDGAHFTNVKSAIKTANGIIVTDVDGLYYSGETVLAENADAVCRFNGKVYFSAGENLVSYDGTATESLNVGEKITDIAAGGTGVFILTENSILKYDGIAISEFKNVGGRKIAMADSGNMIYVLDDSFTAYTIDGQTATFPFNESVENIVDFDIDFIGNLLIAEKTKLVYYTRSLLNFDKTAEIVLQKQNFDLGELTSVSISGENECVFTTTNDFVGKTNTLSFITESNYSSTTPPKAESVSNAVINKTSFFYKDYKNFESVEEIGKNSKIIALNSADENFTYVLWGKKLGYIKTADVTLTADEWTKQNNLKVVIAVAKLYDYPSQEFSPFITVAKGTKLTIIGEGYQNEQSWYKVEYDGKKYYVNVSGLSFDTEHALTNEKTVYGRATAAKIGEKVTLYALPDKNSTIVDYIIDGKELTVIGEQVNGFYKVKIGTQNGYIKVSEIKIGGLTNAQIIGITCAAVAVVAGVVILIITTKVKKKKDAENKTDEDKPLKKRM